MVPQAIGISLCNRIGDSVGEFLVIFPLGVFISTMGLILLTCSLFLLVSGLHFIVCSSIDTPLYLFDPWPAFYHCLLCIRGFLAKSRVHMPIYADFWPKVTYICLYTKFFGQNSCTYAHPHGVLAKSRIYTQLFFKQSRTSSLLVSLMLWKVVGWVVSVVGSSLGLMLSVGCFFCDQRPFFH